VPVSVTSDGKVSLVPFMTTHTATQHVLAALAPTLQIATSVSRKHTETIKVHVSASLVGEKLTALTGLACVIKDV